jgi:hypothetical protein
MSAGGPSWPALVEGLLTIALTKGHEITRFVPAPGNTPDHASFRAAVERVERLDLKREIEALAILDRLRQNPPKASFDDLLRGAEICHELFGPHLFTHVTALVYGSAGKVQPASIHQVIARLAQPLEVPGRDPHRPLPGWEAIITYNYDDLIGEAIDAEGLARCAWAFKRSDLYGDPNKQAKAAGRDGLSQTILHLHGYIPRRLFVIGEIDYVLTTAQYQNLYQRASNKGPQIALDTYLANPVHLALYLGCSFSDESMNDLLRAAERRCPGRMHYALLQWPDGAGAYATASAEAIEERSTKYKAIGVRPIWFESFDELPELVGRLA